MRKDVYKKLFNYHWCNFKLLCFLVVLITRLAIKSGNCNIKRRVPDKRNAGKKSLLHHYFLDQYSVEEEQSASYKMRICFTYLLSKVVSLMVNSRFFWHEKNTQFFYLYFYFSSNKKGDLRLMPRWIRENRKQFQLRNLNVFQQTLQENSNGIIATESAREILHFPQLAKLSALERTAGESVKPTTVTSSSTFPSQVTTPTL